MSNGIQAVQQAVEARGMPFEVADMGRSTRTAAEAAEAVGCRVDQIAKSLVFVAKASGRPMLVVASGAVRVDTGKLAALAGEPVAMASASMVKEVTGYPVGAVPPVALAQPLEVWIDRHLMTHPFIWAAAGSVQALFRLRPTDLPALTGGQVVDLAVG